MSKDIQGYWSQAAEEKKRLASSDSLINELNLKLIKIKALIEEKMHQMRTCSSVGASFEREELGMKISFILKVVDSVVSNQFFSAQIFASLPEIENVNSFLNNLNDNKLTVNFIILINRLKLLCKEKASKLKSIEDQVHENMSFTIEENEEVAPAKTEALLPQPGKVLKTTEKIRHQQVTIFDIDKLRV